MDESFLIWWLNYGCTRSYIIQSAVIFRWHSRKLCREMATKLNTFLVWCQLVKWKKCQHQSVKNAWWAKLVAVRMEFWSHRISYKMKYFAFSISTYADSMHRKASKEKMKQTKKTYSHWREVVAIATAIGAKRKWRRSRRRHRRRRRMLNTGLCCGFNLCCDSLCVCELYVLSRHRFNVFETWFMNHDSKNVQRVT